MNRIAIAAWTVGQLMAGTLLASAGEVIRFQGSDALGAKLVPVLCALYGEKNASISFEIAAEGSTAGFEALREDRADIGMSERDIKREEEEGFVRRRLGLVRATAAIDGLAVVVHTDNPVAALTRKQVERIFTGEVKDWKQLGGPAAPVSVYRRNTSSGSFAGFKELAMSRRDYSPAAIAIPGAESPADWIGRDPSGITYLGWAYAQASGIKPLRIDGYDLHDLGYPYRRPCYYFTRADARGSVRDFVEWATHAPEALAVVAKLGFLPPGK